ncbi:adenosylcobalamin-dependent ribonucleoside-diphosphate reductase [Thermosipho sp. (in: thermotogales)]|jgi:ribonucleoside-diphosphate reductase alpha chain|uniref:adenosylcobalamin-dependent ribonucleoside-diphosphate reductase n=1 Tax=Thermosipho sp. (in: thermotogales) TaxID=1968895 RepID=UPI002579A0F2|nr:adenosylcobalamin-dependent ribonucleoside-diphosphate reductase [Thermosipho sp. (in: thermotogales)]MBZ4650615.1 ribonucleoside-diphosphate reductase, adenosylcobalamin-dependent [Thermosipho sp. (in: thermotogales)]
MYEDIIKRWLDVEPSKNAYKILSERYFIKDISGNFLENKWEDVCRRVARVVATSELVNNPQVKKMDDAKKLEIIKETEETFFKMLKARIFIPNSPTLFNAGMGVRHELLWKPIENMTLSDYQEIYNTRNHLHMLSACFVVPVDDSINGIFEAVKEYALITKAGGGIGSNFSSLRPKGSFVAGTHGQASGPVSFMHVFNSAIGVVEQGYKRRGALMGILNINHPDIEEFITAKENNDGEKVLKYFNISVGIPFDKKELLRLYEEDGEIELSHPKFTEKRYIKARDIIKQIAENAWKTGDPGLAFLHEMNKYYPLYPEMKIISTNPCGEIGLAPYEACNLGSIDVAKFVTDDGQVDWDALEDTVRLAVRFLDNVIDVNVFPLEKITNAVRNSRRLGLGIMGFADLLYKLDIPYNSEEGRQFAADLMGFMALHGHDESNKLGREKGSFPLFEKSKFFKEEEFVPFAMGMSKYDEDIKKVMRESKKGKRNVAVLTIAPTGSISNIADTSSGLEPNFLLAYVRYMNKHDGTKESLFYVNKVLEKKLDPKILEKIKEKLIEKGSLQNLDVPEEIKKVFVTAMDISPMDHLLMQDAFQRYVDNNISKTINMPNSATKEDVLNIYLEALKLNVRGLTIYRDGSLQTQVLTSAKHVKTKDAPKVQFFLLDEKHKLRPRPRKSTLRSVTRKYKSNENTTYITVSFDDNGEAVEIFLSNGTELAESIGRLSSIALRAGVSIEEILEQLQKVNGEYTRGLAEEIKKAIDDFIELWGNSEIESDEAFIIDGTVKTAEEVEKFVMANDLEWSEGYYVDENGNVYCPSCLSKNSIIKQEGCMSCKKCGWSKCS